MPVTTRDAAYCALNELAVHGFEQINSFENSPLPSTVPSAL